MTAPYTQHKLEAMLADLESDLVERKESLRGDNPRKIRQAVCAFANDLPDHQRPGVVFVGADDAGAPVGLEITDELLLQLADVKTDGNIVPPPTLTVDRRVLLGTPVAVVTVMPSDTPPVRHRGRIWIRVGPRRAIASAQDERILNEKRRHRDPHFDVQPVPTASVADLDLRRFEEEYLPLAVDATALAENDRSTEQRLAALKMIAAVDDPRPTIAGILVLGKNPQDFLPAAFAQFLRIAGTDLADPVVDDGRCGGPIAHLVRGLDDKLLAHNRTAVDFTSGPVEVRTPTYPMAALQQLVRNAVMHRTYEGTNAPIHVYWFDDRIEITSPGGPYGALTAENFGQPGLVDYRNQILAEAMRVLGLAQRYGAGIPTARRALLNNGQPERLPRRAELGALHGEGPRVMTPVLTFFNNKGGVGKTSLVYHAAWMLSELNQTVLVVDLDPQANLTAAFLDEDTLAGLWNDRASSSGKTIHQCVAPLTRVGDIRDPELQRPSDRLYLLPGDLALSGFEDLLSTEWPNCLGSTNLYRAFRVITAFSQVVQRGAGQSGADIVLVDVGPSLGAINRSALIATDFVAVPLAADLSSWQGLRYLGSTLRRWRVEWKQRRDNWIHPDFALPTGNMQPIGYLIRQHGIRLSRPVEACDRWARQMPSEYSRSVLGNEAPAAGWDPQADEHCIATVKHYRSLVPLAQDARKPIFSLSAGDGALGSHAVAARDAFRDFRALVENLLRRTHAASAAAEQRSSVSPPARPA